MTNKIEETVHAYYGGWNVDITVRRRLPEEDKERHAEVYMVAVHLKDEFISIAKEITGKEDGKS